PLCLGLVRHPPPPPTCTLSPYTTLFRSGHAVLHLVLDQRWPPDPHDHLRTRYGPRCRPGAGAEPRGNRRAPVEGDREGQAAIARSEEHTSELHSRENLVCRLLREQDNVR